MTGLSSSRWPIVVMAIGSGILAAGAVGKAPPAVSLLREEYSLGLVYAGWILSVLSALGMIAGTGFGTLADRLGPRTVLLGGLWIQAIAGTLAVLSESASILLITRLLEGAGFLAVAVSAPGIIFAASSSGVRVWSLGLWSINVPVGISLAMIFAALTLETIGWRGVWLFYVVLISALAILGHQILPQGPGFSSREPSTTSLMPVLRRLGPWLLAGSFIAYTMMWISIMAWLPTYLINHRGLVSGTASLLSAAVVAANVPGNLLGTWLLSRQWSGGTIVALSSIGMGLSTYIVFSEQFDDVLRYGFCVVFSFVGGLLPAAILGTSRFHVSDSERLGTVNGMIIQGSHLGQFVGPPVVAMIVTIHGQWQDVRWFMVGCALVALILAVALHRIERRQAWPE